MKFRCKCFSKDFCVIYSLVYFCWFVNLLLIQKEKKLKKKKKKKKNIIAEMTSEIWTSYCHGGLLNVFKNNKDWIKTAAEFGNLANSC